MLSFSLIFTNMNASTEEVVYSNNISLQASSYNEYSKKEAATELSLAQKKKEVLKNYKLTDHEYKTIAGIVASEAKHSSYEDSYAVVNTIYNRTKSKRWVRHVDNLFGKGKGKSLYYQVIAPNQFTVYSSGSYKKYVNNIPETVEKALINLLYTEESIHNYLSFKSNSTKGAGTVQFASGGNRYHNKLTVNDTL